MTLKEEIEKGSDKIRHYKRLVEKLLEDQKKIKSLVDEEDPIALSILSLQDIKIAEYHDKTFWMENRVAQAEKEHLAQFEIQSAECNAQMPRMIELARKKIDCNPLEITSLFPELINKYESSADTISQEDKNNIYFALKQHIHIINTKFKK